jgi:virginiamycin B lyase
MIRQVLFGVLALVACGPELRAQGPGQPVQPGAAAPARPPSDIPFARLTADAVLPVTMEAGATGTEDAVWVAGPAAGTITRLDAKANTAGTPIAVGNSPCASLSAGFGSVWVPLCGSTSGVARVDVATAAVAATVPVKVAGAEGRTAIAVGSLWVISSQRGVLSRVDPDTNAPIAETYVAEGAEAVVAGEDGLWVTSGRSSTLTRVNPHNNEVVEIIKVGANPGPLAVGEGGVWTLNRGDGGNGTSAATVSRVDPKTNKVVATISVGELGAPAEIAAGEGAVWISAPGVPITRIDPRTNRAVQRFTGDGGGAILVAHGSLWVAAGAQKTWRLDPALVTATRP